jgi:hypothetical protein
MPVTDFFEYSVELRQFAPQIKTDQDAVAYEPFYRPEEKRLINTITKATFDELKTFYNANKEDITSVKGLAANYLRGALANLLAIPYFIFESSERNNTDNSLYRYQENKQIEVYTELGVTEINNLLDHMEANPGEAAFAGYIASANYVLRQSLYLKNKTDFKRYYGAIDSSYFYANIVYLIEEVQNDEIIPRLKDWPVIDSDNLGWLIGKAMVYEVLSRACMQFDYTELPVSIRSDIVKEFQTRKAKGRISETDIRNTKSEAFKAKAGMYFLKIEEAHNEDRNNGTYIMDESTVTEKDKFYIPGFQKSKS